MLNFKAFYNQEVTLDELVAPITRQDLRDLSNEMVDAILKRIAGCTDAEVIFQPSDPQANDRFAQTPEEVKLAWTLGHVIVHTTSSAEESAALAAELARGVEFHGRSRYEIPWQEMHTIQQCRERLEESRRMRLAVWNCGPPRRTWKTIAKPGLLVRW
jgi:hypothetical protein